MPKVAYSEEDRERIRTQLVAVGLELMAKQGIQHTTVEQVYKKVGISRTFFYSFFSTKEDLIVETLYLQQPKIIQYVQALMADPALARGCEAVSPRLLLWRGKRHCSFNHRRTAADFQAPVTKELSSVSPKTAPSFRRNFRKLRHQGRYRKNQPIYKFKLDRDGGTQSHPQYASPVCPGSRG